MLFDATRDTVTSAVQRAKQVKNDPKGYAKEVGSEVVHQINDAYSSTGDAYKYPIEGIFYFANHPDIYRSIGALLFKGALTSLAITVAMFAFLYLPQAAFLSLFASPIIGFPAAIMLVLVESWLVVTAVVKMIFIDPFQDELFDRVLRIKGLQQLVAGGPKPLSAVTKVVQKAADRFSPVGLAQYLLTLPLNFVPVFGPIAFFLLNGRRVGQSFHHRYFRLKGWNGDRRHTFVQAKKGAYMAFGVVSLALQMVPVLNVVFAATSTVGAALWAAEMEKSGEADRSYGQQGARKSTLQMRDVSADH